MLFVALSSLQGIPQSTAYKDLLLLQPDGIQLTAGNLPTNNFKNEVNIPYKYHHAFEWTKRKGTVYDDNFKPIIKDNDHSIHPPFAKINFNKWIESCNDIILETMYPGYLLGNGDEIEIAMLLNKRLAVDISHVHIMKTQGVITNSQINKLLNYDNIVEIHISHNNGKYDTHSPICKNTPFLHWIKERTNVLFVYESYLHKLNLCERLSQLEIIKNIIHK
jgi:hypothetical protein